MTHRILIKTSFKMLILALVFGCHSRLHLEQEDSGRGTREAAVGMLQYYINLRLRDAHWKEYSQLITWPDEPGWDCKWVINKHSLGVPEKHQETVVIPVVYNRLGLFCHDFDFKSDPKVITINYELVMSPNGWKINSPEPDYPGIDPAVLLKSLNAAAGNADLRPEHREEAEITARKIMEAIKQDGS